MWDSDWVEKRQGLRPAFPDQAFGEPAFHGGKSAAVHRASGETGYRRAWIDAADYMHRWDAWRRGNRAGDPLRRDPPLDTLAGVLRGEILVQNHCYRADEMAVMIDIAREFGFRIRTFPMRTRPTRSCRCSPARGFASRLGPIGGTARCVSSCPNPAPCSCAGSSSRCRAGRWSCVIGICPGRPQRTDGSLSGRARRARARMRSCQINYHC